MKYVVYLTAYRGNKLPPFYIGSTSTKRISAGYNGSIKSKQYKTIFDKERRDNPHLFKTMIICEYSTRTEALECELKLQTKLNVVKSSMYMNMSIAKNFGWFGMNCKGINAPAYGKTWKWSDESKVNFSIAQSKLWSNPEYSLQRSKQRKGKYHRPKEVIEFHAKRKYEIKELFASRPQLFAYGHKSKNGKIYTYTQAFADYYSKIYSLTPQAIRQMLK